MREIKGDLWGFPAHWRGITTNGFVKNNGDAVMGRGAALQAARRWPWLPAKIGAGIREHGRTAMLVFSQHRLFTFPVKYHWADNADLELIVSSATQLDRLARRHPEHTFVLGRPGCGNGKLQWAHVRRMIAPLLNDQIYIISYPHEA